ncbi:MAG: RDD family protein [Puniceicoccales bacterium]|jgi:hypothetical protein|nr:RDD family protein [Puniceicoccales bacterium]
MSAPAPNSPPPPPAPFLWRSLAHSLDWLLALFGSVLLVKWFVIPRHPDALAAFGTWMEGIATHYERLRQTSALNASQNAHSLSEKINHIPEPLLNLVSEITLVQLSVFLAYFTATEHFMKGASPGKRIFHLRTLRTADATAPRFHETLARSAWKTLFLCSPNILLLLVGLLDLLMACFHSRHRSLHDRLSRTEVVDIRNTPAPAPSQDTTTTQP